MKINILAFGIAKDILEGASKEMDLPGGTTIQNLKYELETTYPGLKKLRSYLIAVNDEYADDSLMVREQDEIAIIPPVSGG